MKRIQLEIKAISPLAISRQKPGGSVSEAEDYIPGSVIRGAIASEILKASGEQFSNLSENGGNFQALFLGDEPAIFQNAYPSIEIKSKVILKSWNEEIKVLPITALSSKTKPGFQTEKKNGVFDTLIDRFCAEKYGLVYEPNCPKDNGRVEQYTGFYSKYNGRYYSVIASKRLLTRVGINRLRATAEEDILYSIQVLDESQTSGKNQKPVIYKGTILVPDNLSESLKQFIKTRYQSFRLGGSTSRGLGKVEINTKDLTDVQISTREKITDFNNQLQIRWRKWSIFGKPLEELPKNRTYFTLNLQADAILTDKWQRTTVVSAQMLQQLVDVEDESLKLEVVYSSYDYRSGWNAAWGLMKDVELVTNKGAAYLFSTIQPDIWYEALAKLEFHGVGERTCEGFGQVEVCNDFHLVFREGAV